MGESIMTGPETYGTVKLAMVKAAIKQIEDHYAEHPERIDDIDITFEYLVGSFFPKILENMNIEFNKQYTKGYMQGLQEGMNWGKTNDN
jgi:hypothetical protein